MLILQDRTTINGWKNLGGRTKEGQGYHLRVIIQIKMRRDFCFSIQRVIWRAQWAVVQAQLLLSQIFSNNRQYYPNPKFQTNYCQKFFICHPTHLNFPPTVTLPINSLSLFPFSSSFWPSLSPFSLEKRKSLSLCVRKGLHLHLVKSIFKAHSLHILPLFLSQHNHYVQESHQRTILNFYCLHHPLAFG